MHAIEQKDLDEYFKYISLAGGYGEKIEKRIDHILRRVHQEFNSRLNYWYWDDAPEGDQGQLHRHIDRNFRDNSVITSYITDATEGDANEWCIVLNDGTVHDFYGIPAKWLFEDFESELVEGKRLWEEREAAKKQEKAARRAVKKSAREAAKVSAAAKLTPEERQALGI